METLLPRQSTKHKVQSQGMDHFEASSDLDTSDELTEEGCEITFERVVLNGDLEEDGDCQERPGSLLWEKSFEQSIFVDIEDDGSFHFSDLQDSYTFQLSQDSAEDTSLNLIGQHMEELDSYGNIQDKTTSESSFESHKVHGTKSSITRISEQRHNTMEDLPLHTPDLLVDTSDEEQEDLPYDDNFDSNNKAITTDSNMDDYRIPLAISNNILTGHLSNIRDAGKPNKNTNGEFSFPVCVSSCETENNENEIDTISEVTKVPVKNDHQLSTFSPELNCFEGSQSGIPEVLLRHFSEENLFSSSKYIEAETMPETSFTESVETETVLNRFKSRHNSPKYNEGKSLLGKDLCKVIELETEPKEQREDDTSKNSECQKTEEISSAESSNTETQDEVSDQLNGPDSPEIIDNEGNQSQRSLFGRAGYCNDIKYGQGQVHYPLPDFSKVAPKIKIPKGSSATNLNNPTPGIKRTESSPGLFSNSTTSLKSAVDVVKEVLDTIQPHETPFDFRDQQKRQYNPKQNPELVQHLQDEYDKLLTKYAEAENLIDQMRLGAKIPLLSDSPKPIENIDSGVMPPHANITTFRVANPTTAQLGSTPRSPLTGSATDMQDTEVPNNNDTDTTHREPTEGEKMTQALKEMINQFTAKVDEFKSCLNSGTLTVEEQQEIFKSMMDAQDKLERGYMAQKDGHRALELRNDMGKTENIGEFDPERYFCESSDMSQESLDVTLCEDGSCNPSAATVKAKDIVYNGISTEPRHTLESRLQTPELSMFPLLTKMTRSCSSSSDVSSSCIEMDDTRPTDSKGLNDALGFADLSDGSTVGHWTHSIVSDSNPTGEQGSIAQLSGHLIGESSDDHLLLPTPWHCGPPVPTLGNVTSTVDKDSHPCALQNGRKHMQYRNKKVFTVNRDSSPQKVDDWISSDMEPSTDSEGSSHSFSPSVSHPLHYKADRKSHRRPSRSEEREDSCLVKHQSTDEDYTFSSPRRKHSNALINSQSYSLCNSESNHSSCK
ncbi:AT-hook-containing transcription factor [Acipenser ruthenus]|uniref:AT-hook-containing transcription factor n=1 Tax=Acipenser ruthenus TaxID=7906 RepID=A0A444TZI4_ACIRT|nr:AT-hook-containing transcription factor [Acipenser ruthenus]